MADTAPVCSVMTDEFGHFAQDWPNKIPPPGTPPHQKQILFKALIYPHPRGTDHAPPTMVIDIRDISTYQNPTAIPTATGLAVSEGSQCTPHSATTVAHATFWVMDVPIAICTVTYQTGIVTPLPTLATSPMNITHTTITQTRASLLLLHCTGKHSQEKPSHTQDLQPPHKPHHSKTVLTQDSPSDSSSDSDSDSDPLNY